MILRDRGTTSEDDVVQPLELDRAVDVHVGTRTRWQSSVDRYVYCNSASLRRRIHPRHMTPHHSISSVDQRGLTDGEVPGLRLSDAEHCLELTGLQAHFAGNTRLNGLQCQNIQWPSGEAESDARYPIPDTRYPIPDTRYPIPDTRHPTPDTRHPTPDFR